MKALQSIYKMSVILGLSLALGALSACDKNGGLTDDEDDASKAVASGSCSTLSNAEFQACVLNIVSSSGLSPDDSSTLSTCDGLASGASLSGDTARFNSVRSQIEASCHVSIR